MQSFFKSLALFACALTGVFAAPVRNDLPSADLTSLISKEIPDSYIVVLKKDLSTSQAEAHQRWAADIHSRRLLRRDDASLKGITAKYDLNKFKGYAGSFDKETIEAIKSSPDVAYVEKDGYAVVHEKVVQTGVPTWGLPRVSQADLAANVDFTRYTYDSSGGQGTYAYVIDTGILLSHVEFGGRAEFGATFTSDGTEDGYGHGTHVSGTIAGATYGIAKKAKLVSVKVLDSSGSGTWSGVLSGIEWTAKDAAAKGRSKKSVANMSLGGGKVDSINAAVKAAVDTGVTFVVSAGNSYDDSKWYSPASELSAITVGATEISDRKADFSNYGPIVDVHAPGVSIVSAWIGADNKTTRSISGTSMASPHVAGVAAYLIAFEGLSGPAAIDARIKQLAIPVVTSPGANTTNGLLNTRAVPAKSQLF